MRGEIIEYMPNADGSRRRSLKIDGITVMVEPHGDDAAARALAERLAGAPQPAPISSPLLGPGYVRFRGRDIWVLGSREKGWAAFGYRFASWDSLFRTWRVVVTDHGIDEHGAWWKVENGGGQ